MPTTFLNISLALESEDPLDLLQENLHQDLEFALAEYGCKVFSVTWDREQALRFLQAQQNKVVQLDYAPAPISEDVTFVLSKYNLTIPKPKRGEPPWKVPQKHLFGQVHGLDTLKGEIVLTNGIMAFLVRSDGAWYDVHWNHFVADDLDDLPDDLPRPQRPVKKVEAFVGLGL